VRRRKTEDIETMTRMDDSTTPVRSWSGNVISKQR